MKQVKWCIVSMALIAVVLFAAACVATGADPDEVTEYDINIGMAPGTEPRFVSVQEMKDSMLFVGSNSSDVQPTPEEIEVFLLEKASSAGWNDYQLLFSHLVTSLHNYDNYFVLAGFDVDGERHMEAGIVGIYVEGEKKGTIDDRADTFSPGLKTTPYRDSPVQMNRRQHMIKHTPGGMYKIMFAVITDPNVELLELGFAYGPRLRMDPDSSPLGRFTKQLDSHEYACFLLVLTETHGPRGDRPVRGFPHSHILLTNWSALDEDGAEIESWADPDYGE